MKSYIKGFSGRAALALTGAIAGCATSPVCESQACRRDAEIGIQVRSLLDQSPDLSPNQIHVEIRNHVVYLYGLVNTEFEWMEAQELAHSARDVARVVNVVGISN